MEESYDAGLAPADSSDSSPVVNADDCLFLCMSRVYAWVRKGCEGDGLVPWTSEASRGLNSSSIVSKEAWKEDQPGDTVWRIIADVDDIVDVALHALPAVQFLMLV